MPKSFLVKNKKSFYNPIPVKVANCLPSRANGVTPPQRLIQSSRSAFESFNGNQSSKSGKRENYIVNGDISNFLSTPSYSTTYQENTYQEDLKELFASTFKSKSDSIDLAYGDLKSDQCCETLKENIKSQTDDGSVNFPVVKGPLPQSTFICQLCKQVYNDAFALAQHKCSGIKHVEHRCPECSKVFSCPANLASHRRWHRPRSPTTNKPLKLSKTKSSKETDPRSRKNPLTDVSTETSDQQENIEERTGETEKVEVKTEELDGPQDENNNSDDAGSEHSNGEYACDQCGKTFRRQAYLRKHVNYHANNRPYPCQYCGKVFRSLTNRARHVLNHAVGPKGHACDVCGNRFPNRATLEKHSRIHNGEIFTCSQCSCTFYSSPGLQRHFLKCHSQSEDTQNNMLVSAR